MRPLPVITDPVFKKREYSALDRFFINMIRDERDLPFVYLSIQISLVLIPLGLALYLPILPWWAFTVIAVAYFFFNNFVYKGSFGLMLHCTSHRKWFKKEYGALNLYLPWFVGLFFGQTPETYFSHHIGMHHPENNLEDDRSTTMHYQRDSFKSFMLYFLNFLLLGIKQVAEYFLEKKRRVLFRKLLMGEAVFILMCVGLCFVNFWATFHVFMLPFIISRFIMMAGNFAQHSFVDPEDPGNAYKNSITCINVKYNHKCWNDGYHISHHIRPTMHWTEHPVYFQKTLDEYVENDALVFDGIEFLGVWYNVLTRNYDKLADHLVNIDGSKTREHMIEVMKRRTQRIPRPEGAWTALA